MDARLAAGVAVVFVDHDPGRLAGRAGRRLWLEGGRLGPAPADGPAAPAVVEIELAGTPGPPLGRVLLAGLLAQFCCVLVGVAVGAACNPPVLRSPGAAVLATGFLVVPALASSSSPASAAIRTVSGTAGDPQVGLPVSALAVAGAVCAVAVAGSALVARARGVD